MMLDVVVKCLEKSKADHLKIRHHRRETFTISVKDGEIDALNNGYRYVYTNAFCSTSPPPPPASRLR